MKLEQYLSEAFDKPVPYTVKKTSEFQYVADFAIGDNKYRAFMEYETSSLRKWKVIDGIRYERWELSFGIWKNGDWSEKLSGTGNAFAVFATVVKFAMDIVERAPKEIQKGVGVIEFYAAKEEGDHETNRGRLYTRMAKRLVPKDWVVKVHDGKEFVELYMEDPSKKRVIRRPR